MELAAFAVWCFLVALAGGLVGLVLGNIRLPATLLVSPNVAAAGGANLLISGAAAAAAAAAHIRAGRMHWRLFWWMAPPSIAGAVAGGYLAGTLDEDVLLAVIAAV
ncbi:MAG: TSUP family transporter, partial [Solirubrobacteraceae bacterium]|nr:TSUP family transporter [Solirubrobacteraceae bacterium]